MTHIQPSDGVPASPTSRPALARRLVPRDAATLIVVDESGPAPRVLMGRRNPRLAFMPGQFVFPGGRVERSDRYGPALGELPPEVDSTLALRVARPGPGRARALALAAIRETFEETGLLIGRPADAPPRRAVAPAWAPFLDAGILPDLSALHLVGRAITPPGRPRRFDARFFACPRSAVAGGLDGFVGPDREFVELAWLPIESPDMGDVPAITAAMLATLARRLKAGLAAPAEIPFHYVRHGRRVVDRLVPGERNLDAGPGFGE